MTLKKKTKTERLVWQRHDQFGDLKSTLLRYWMRGWFIHRINNAPQTRLLRCDINSVQYGSPCYWTSRLVCNEGKDFQRTLHKIPLQLALIISVDYFLYFVFFFSSLSLSLYLPLKCMKSSSDWRLWAISIISTISTISIHQRRTSRIEGMIRLSTAFMLLRPPSLIFLFLATLFPLLIDSESVWISYVGIFLVGGSLLGSANPPLSPSSLSLVAIQNLFIHSSIINFLTNICIWYWAPTQQYIYWEEVSSSTPSRRCIQTLFDLLLSKQETFGRCSILPPRPPSSWFQCNPFLRSCFRTISWSSVMFEGSSRSNLGLFRDLLILWLWDLWWLLIEWKILEDF